MPQHPAGYTNIREMVAHSCFQTVRVLIAREKNRSLQEQGCATLRQKSPRQKKRCRGYPWRGTCMTWRSGRRYTQSSEKASGRAEVKFKIEIGREDDGRWIAEIASLPGVMAYGKTRQEAIAEAEALALRIAKHTGLAPEDL